MAADDQLRQVSARLPPAAPLSVAHIALLLPWVTAVIAARLPIRDNSFLWHVEAGRVQLERSSVITSDPFSFTFAGEAWRTQSWLIELFYGSADQVWGLGFVGPFLALTALTTFALILMVTFRLTRSLEATVVVGVLSAWLSASFLSPRPVVLSYALLAMVIAVSGVRHLRWSLVPIIWLWAAVHGSFVLGIGYIVLDAIRRRDRRAVGDVLAMTVVASLTAHGIGVWQVLLDFVGGTESLGLITEWRTPELTSLGLAPFLGGVLLLIVAATRGHFSLRDLWVVGPFIVFGVAAARSVFPAWIALAPFVGLAFRGMPRATSTDGRSRRPLLIVGTLLLVFPFVLPTKGGLAESFPVEAAGSLTADRVFHDDIVGGYLMYRDGTDRGVFVDDRAELYPADHFRDVIGARNATPVWRDVFKKWEIEQALLRGDDRLVDVLRETGWRTDFEDEEFVVLSSPER